MADLTELFFENLRSRIDKTRLKGILEFSIRELKSVPWLPSSAKIWASKMTNIFRPNLRILKIAEICRLRCVQRFFTKFIQIETQCTLVRAELRPLSYWIGIGVMLKPRVECRAKIPGLQDLAKPPSTTATRGPPFGGPGPPRCAPEGMSAPPPPPRPVVRLCRVLHLFWCASMSIKKSRNVCCTCTYSVGTRKIVITLLDILKSRNVCCTCTYSVGTRKIVITLLDILKSRNVCCTCTYSVGTRKIVITLLDILKSRNVCCTCTYSVGTRKIVITLLDILKSRNVCCTCTYSVGTRKIVITLLDILKATHVSWNKSYV